MKRIEIICLIHINTNINSNISTNIIVVVAVAVVVVLLVMLLLFLFCVEQTGDDSIIPCHISSLSLLRAFISGVHTAQASAI